MYKWIVVTLLFGIPLFIMAPSAWPSPAGSPAPGAMQIPFFIILSVFESFSFGLGVAFLMFAYPIVKKAGTELRTAVWGLYLSTGWLLVNWWVHDGLHKINGENLQGLLYIEYSFHVTLIIAGTLAVYSFFRILTTRIK